MRAVLAVTIAAVATTTVVGPVAAVATTAEAPACVPGGETIVLDGTVAPEEAKTYRYLPFEVAAGTTRVEVAYDWGDQDPLLAEEPQNQTVVDLGLWDADGLAGADAFRGWGGSRQGVISRDMPPVWVQADSADRGFTPGAVEPGTWHVELGFGNVNRGGGTWHVEITCLDPEVGPEPPYEPVDASHVADPEPGWFHGDFHMHGYHSNPDGPTHEEVVDNAREVGLDIVLLTEYVTTVHHGTWGPVAAANPDLLVVPGREVITYFGHANVLGETPDVVDYRHGYEDVTLGDIQRRSVEAGALFQVNHPTIFPEPVFTSFCRGCEFNLTDAIDLDLVTTVEVLTGPVEVGPEYIGGPPGPGIENPFVDTAIDYYEELLLAGHVVTPVSGSDAKHVDGHGSSATAVWAEELSRSAVFDGLRAGATYVRTRGVADSPAIEVTATAGDDTVMLGGTLVTDQATMTIHVTGAQGQVAEVTRNGQAYLNLPIASDDETLTVPLVRTADEGPLGTFHRVDVREPSGIRSVLSSAIFLADQLPDRGGDSGEGDTSTAGTDSTDGTDADDQPGLAATGGGAALVGVLALVLAARLHPAERVKGRSRAG